MTDQEIKKQLESSLKSFKDNRLSANALNLFKTLGYDTSRQLPLTDHNYVEFKATYDPEAKLNETNAKVSEWKSVDLLFQLSEEEMKSEECLFEKKVVTKDDGSKIAIESYLFFVIELAGKSYTRTDLSRITREINKLFPMPAMILFKAGQTLSFAIINRRLHKRDEGKDVLEKVTLIKDINLEAPHRAHTEILFDLSFKELLRKHKFTNFVELHNAWQKTLDTKELNKRFYRELSDWYFWARDKVRFPNDDEKDWKNRNAISLIRLITRLIFIWFIKEKGLVPEVLFNQIELKKILKEFNSGENSDSYYRAILQNLFFGTLNRKMDERAFAVEEDFLRNKKEYGVKNLFRYADLFTISKEQILALFKDIPFLNGGLFDCLDKLNDEGKVVHVDGFSRDKKKQAVVPDYLFFSNGEKKEVDLNEIYGSKNKKYYVQGLFDILSSYKFTVTENTPIEEEVALDPELLGRVFENLLASYNPETKTTARKQTGSFYTPREIVNYMVDESLKAYLKNQLGEKGGMKEEDLDIALAFLFEYNEKEHLFNEEQVNLLINAIDSAKILDPACGSGAFPMGILHKLVHILHKLDPYNQKWKKRQMEKVDSLINDAKKITDNHFREKVVAGLEENKQDIELAFENNELDYGRKLYLIENCIYGVDIQPIAIQIAKLRFFISLVVDQKKQPEKENLGIRALPNLETKFVAANTLVGLEKSNQGMLHNPEIDKLEGELKSLRHQYFSARTRPEKLSCQKKDRELRRKIGELLLKEGLSQDTVNLIAAFDPYDQNASAPFFDPEWMFGVKGGFDVVIGNPPYVNTKRGIEEDFKIYLKFHYKTAQGQFDIFCLFIEKATYLGEIISLIVPKPMINNENYIETRRILFGNGLKTIVVGSNIFENAGVESCIFICDKQKSGPIAIWEFKDEKFELKWLIDYETSKKMPFEIINTELNSDDLKIITKIKINTIPLKEILTITRGIEAGKNDLSITKEKTKYPLLRGEDISNYTIDFQDYFVKYDINDSVKFKTLNIYEPEKILIRRVGNELIAAYDNKGYFTLNAIYNCKPYIPLDIKFIFGIINSSLIKFWFKKVFILTDKLFPYIRVSQLNFIPFKIDKLFIMEISRAVSFLICHSNKKISDKNQYFTHLIDSMIYQLYFPDEIKAADCEVLKHLTGLPELKDDWSDEQKLKIIEQVYQELSRPEHPVSLAMKKMREEVKEVRIIEGIEK